MAPCAKLATNTEYCLLNSKGRPENDATPEHPVVTMGLVDVAEPAQVVKKYAQSPPFNGLLDTVAVMTPNGRLTTDNDDDTKLDPRHKAGDIELVEVWQIMLALLLEEYLTN